MNLALKLGLRAEGRTVEGRTVFAGFEHIILSIDQVSFRAPDCP
jgi:hypothetical protein